MTSTSSGRGRRFTRDSPRAHRSLRGPASLLGHVGTGHRPPFLPRARGDPPPHLMCAARGRTQACRLLRSACPRRSRHAAPIRLHSACHGGSPAGERARQRCGGRRRHDRRDDRNGPTVDQRASLSAVRVCPLLRRQRCRLSLSGSWDRTSVPTASGSHTGQMRPHCLP